MAGLSGACEVAECQEPAAALVVTDLEYLDEDGVTDYGTQLVPMCRQHAVEELSS